MEILLKCNTCGRLAHNPKFNGRVCDIRLFDGRYCQGLLEPSEPEVSTPDPHLICDTCERRADKLDMNGKVCDWLLPTRKHCLGILRLVE